MSFAPDVKEPWCGLGGEFIGDILKSFQDRKVSSGVLCRDIVRAESLDPMKTFTTDSADQCLHRLAGTNTSIIVFRAKGSRFPKKGYLYSA